MKICLGDIHIYSDNFDLHSLSDLMIFNFLEAPRPEIKKGGEIFDVKALNSCVLQNKNQISTKRKVFYIG